MKPPRVVSLLPSTTEIVCALGAEDQLVGVSHECDWPPSVKGRPVLTAARLREDGGSGAIDRQVRSLVEEALSIYALDEQVLAAAKPDVILTQDLCDVCAVSYDEVLDATRRLAHPGLRVVSVHPTRLGDIWQDVRRVGEVLGREREAQALLAEMDRRVADVERRAGSWLRRSGATPPRVLTLEWIDPPMVGGTWMPELVERAGGVPLGVRPGERAPALSPERLAAIEPPPEVVVIKPCGYTLPRIVREAEGLSELLLGMDWPAVRERRVWIADGNAYFNRSGPRIVDSLEILAACLHPEAFTDVQHRYEGSFRRFGVRGAQGRS